MSELLKEQFEKECGHLLEFLTDDNIGFGNIKWNSMAGDEYYFCQTQLAYDSWELGRQSAQQEKVYADIAYELELHRADHKAMKELGFESVGEMISSYRLYEKLDKPARVLGTIFKAGADARLVIECAQRHYEANPPKQIPADALCFHNNGEDSSKHYVTGVSAAPEKP